jgi:hypothetical protein
MINDHPLFASTGQGGSWFSDLGGWRTFVWGIFAVSLCSVYVRDVSCDESDVCTMQVVRGKIMQLEIGHFFV